MEKAIKACNDERKGEKKANTWVAVNKGRRRGMFPEPYVPGV